MLDDSHGGTALAAEWADITPLPQTEPANAVVRIAYQPEFVKVMDLFRAVLKSDELSERACRLAGEAIRLNSANYVAWHFRLKCVKALGGSAELLRQELDLIAEIAAESAKNYQLWQHRRCVVELLGDALDLDVENQWMATVFEDDEKNYHAWGYRQWLVQSRGLWDEELSFTSSMIQNDLRNNSAWNQRFWVLSQTGALSDPEMLKRQIAFTLPYIELAPKNESPVSFLRGLVPYLSAEALSELVVSCEGLIAQQGAHSMQLLAFVADLGVERNPTNTSLTRSLELYDKLVTLDPVRAAYWTRLRNEAATLAT